MAEPDLSKTLRKKPVRRATAKKTEREPQQKPRTTRGRKAAPTPEEITPEDSAAQESDVPQIEKPARKVGRPKKQAPTPAAEDPTPVQQPSKPTRSTAASRAKTETMAEKRRELPAVSEPKPTRRTRATAPKAQPLSPKKITQVTKPQPRTTRKANTKQAPAKAAPKARVTRNRTVSDENAEIPNLGPDEGSEDEIVLLSSTPVKRSPAKQAAARGMGVESEASMSSACTTPSHSPVPNFDRMNDEHEYHRRTDAESVSHASDEEAANDETANDSDDELCGPKTPMKRSSPGAGARYRDSVQRTVRRAEFNTPMESPRAFVNRISNVGTPQTQKPYNRPAVPASALRPMTVARGGDRAFVFKDLRAVSTVEGECPSHATEADRSTIAVGSDDTEVDEAEHLSEDELPPPVHFQIDEGAEADGDDHFNEDELPPPVHFQDNQGAEADDDELLSEDEMPPPVHFQDDDDTMVDSIAESAEDELSDHSDASEDEVDPDETILLPENQPSAVRSPFLAAVTTQSPDPEDTVLVTREEDNSLFMDLDEDKDAEMQSPCPTSPTPETVVWENLRQDVTIPIDFDSHMANARVQPVTKLADFAPFLVADTEMDAVTGAEQDEAAEEDEQQSSPPYSSSADESWSRQSFDPTMNFNDFIDMAALAEPTQAIELPSMGTEDKTVDQTKISDVSSSAMKDPQPRGGMEQQAADSEGDACQSNVVSETLETGTNEVVRAEMEDDVEQSGQHVTENEVTETEPESGNPTTTEEPEVPHYALTTFAFDARRKSLPAFGMHTPVKNGSRPNTSDGASMPRMINAFGDPWWSRPSAESRAGTPARPSIAHGFASPKKVGTPSATPRALTTACMTPKERYPRREPRQDYQDHAQTVAAPTRFRTPVQSPVKRPATAQKATVSNVTPRASILHPQPKVDELGPAEQPHDAGLVTGATPVTTPSERFPRLGENHANTVAAASRYRTPATTQVKRPATTRKAAATAATPTASSLKPEPARVSEEPKTPLPANSSEELNATPVETPSERFPRLAPREDYVSHAQTNAAPARFRTPAQTPLQRPSTARKPATLRKLALKNISTPKMASQTPVKTPLKAPAMTPAQVPMTPHPAAPLRGVMALVEVFTLEGASASAPFVALLHRLGAKTTKVWSDRVTHVIFKDGSPTTLQRVRLHNKDVEKEGKTSRIHCVNSRWVSDCDAAGSRVDEADEEYAVDVAEMPRGGKRRRKSMEPSALVNLGGGNVVRDRKSSLRRSSLGRSSLSFSPVEKPDTLVTTTPKAVDLEDKENSGDGLSSPATPAYLSKPEELVQQTAPINRVRKLGLKAQGRTEKRRLTYFPSRA